MTTTASMLSFLKVPISEKNWTLRSDAQKARAAFEHAWVAKIVKDVLLSTQDLSLTDLCRLAWEADTNTPNHLVISVFYAYFNAAVVRMNKDDHIIRLVPESELAAYNTFLILPDSAGVKMDALFLLACNPNGLAIEPLFQGVYDRSKADLATRYAIWELIEDGEIAYDFTAQLFHLPAYTKRSLETVV